MYLLRNRQRFPLLDPSHQAHPAYRKMIVDSMFFAGWVLRRRTRPDATLGANLALRLPRRRLHLRRGHPVLRLGKVELPRLCLLLLHNTDHDRLRGLCPRAERQGQRGGQHNALLAVPAFWNSVAGDELQPSAGGGDQQRQVDRQEPGYHQGRGRWRGLSLSHPGNCAKAADCLLQTFLLSGAGSVCDSQNMYCTRTF